MLTPLWIALLTLALPLPIGTDRRLRRFPWVTWTLIGLNVVCYAAIVLQSHALSPNSLAADFVSGPPPTAPVFTVWGLMPTSQAAFHTLFTYQFVHVSLGHLFWNLYFLWLFGPHVEDALGRLTFLALYLGGGVAAGLLHMAIVLILSQRGVAIAPLVGASGAISAVLAPFAIRFHRAQIRLFWLPGLLLPGGWARLEMPAVWALGVWLLQNIGGAVKSVFAPESGGTAYWAHLGGFIFGLVAAQLTGLLQEGHRDYLLEDARTALSRGHDLLADAIQRYRIFLERDPDNAPVRMELARALAQRRRKGDEDGGDAAQEILAAVRLFQKQNALADAARACAEARALGLTLTLTPREHLRLAVAAEEAGERDTAIWFLRTIIEETPDAPEDEMARLRLSGLLLASRPAEARRTLTGFLEKYPDSAWAPHARELLRQTNV